jgi:hypothetical protein
MSNEVDTEQDDPTTPEELLALAKHLAADPKLDAIFRRVGLHKPFSRPDEYGQVLASRRAFAPHLEDRPCSSDNLPVAMALARRLHAGNIASDADALAFVTDRIWTTQRISSSTFKPSIFRQLSGERAVKIHPLVTRMIDQDVLEKLKARSAGAAEKGKEPLAKAETKGSA